MRVERVYEAPDGGVRVLVDRLWPRGLKKEDAQLDRWAKEVAPSAELRRWFHGPQGEYEEFARRYRAELDDPEVQDELAELRELAESGELVLLTAVKEPSHSHVTVLLERLGQSG
ncbi:hypothetical protein KCH_64660 [Kitasatospora cheerisanensis KCTC 2395]|uniref:MarR family transcriptional regulator n=1 Tax=Kitasatospora cheerisanensis KCTC 2395 TaxID=1348663 RepID=A0A066YUI8_9ACTN|nr:hypothetical protein KCH_64660 [Kitasatospora cheerisanensis KCTC 2395]